MTRLFLAAFIAFGALITSAVAQVPNPPRLKSEAIIHGDIVRIGDLIENSGVVADLPRAGPRLYRHRIRGCYSQCYPRPRAYRDRHRRSEQGGGHACDPHGPGNGHRGPDRTD